MARGDLTVYEEFRLTIADGTHDFDADSFRVALITTLPTAADATPQLTDYAEVSGTNYTATGEALTTTWLEAGGTATFDATTNPSWTQNAGGPTNIKAAVVYNNTAGGKNAVAFIDMTNDAGTTPISLVDGDISITWNASGIFTLS